MIQITTFKWVPPFAQGWVRDIRARWALEEAGLPYELRLIGREEQQSAAYRAQQPFSQVPVLQDGDLTLFESGAIVLHIAEKSEKLLPLSPAARSRARVWAIAAVNSIEPFVQSFIEADNASSKEEWAKLRRPSVLQRLQKRLGDLDQWMEGRQYLESEFTAGDILMSCVLRELNSSGVLKEFKNLDQYCQRCLARPAFKKALADQLKTFADNEPKKA